MPEVINQFDAIVIGGGVIGCSIAWRLAQAGMQVAVLERGKVGCEASYAAGGMLAPLAEANAADGFFHLAVASRAMYADFARELKAASGIDIEYRTEGTLYLSLTEEDDEELDRRWQWQHEAGLNVKRLNAECVRKLEPLANEKLRWALKFPDDHQVNNRRLIEALHAAARNAGAHFFPHTEAHQILSEHRAGQRYITGVAHARGNAVAPTVVVAAGCWTGKLLFDGSSTLIPVRPIRGQMIAIEMPATGLNHVIYSRRGYLIPRLGGFVIAGSTTENVGYDKRVTAQGMAAVINKAVEIAPQLQEQAIVETWAGLRPFGLDQWPVIGADPKVNGLLYATAHYRNGILLTPATAKAVSELVLTGNSSINLSPFAPGRFGLEPPIG